ncbi:MAG TPA: L-serine ammonia-lyase, iron-sulfur-dependent, subunit alpha [Candidatus Dojkabacteria bacterium]|nr:L-serine ammonia-lyase, iron-sulfur-dependent, subunit alpha [Candidatus Dojkabacteria bacterium]HQF36127.1 L-serine ammonia-lyase, iron-sulfur-dependent, subunit alpha [Candidatus Dojkabacteria bacterium]
MSFLISVFDIIGPVMIGPSSSHTAGAVKIGYFAYQKLGTLPKEVTIKLYNSFSDTGKGHKTDVALLAGAIGISPEDPRIKDAFEIAKELNVKYTILWGNFDNKYHPNSAEITLSDGNVKITVTGFSIGGGNIKIWEDNETVSQVDTSNSNYLSFTQLKGLVNDTKNPLIQVIKVIEKRTSGLDFEEQDRKMSKIWDSMVESVEEGIKNDKRSISNMYGGDGKRLWDSNSICISKIVKEGVGASIAVAEHNARMGKIVACPTAGSSGVIPGTLYSLVRNDLISTRMARDSLFIAGATGAVVSAVMNLAGAVAGCQAEIGVAGAMCASAITWALGGGVGQIETASSFVLSNVLGLTCDPIGGLVQVPCILRNGAITSMVFTSVDLALSGVKYPIPFDEIVHVAKETGDKMSSTLKETSRGGLATTNTAALHNKFCRMCPGGC